MKWVTLCFRSWLDSCSLLNVLDRLGKEREVQTRTMVQKYLLGANFISRGDFRPDDIADRGRRSSAHIRRRALASIEIR